MATCPGPAGLGGPWPPLREMGPRGLEWEGPPPDSLNTRSGRYVGKDQWDTSRKMGHPEEAAVATSRKGQ